MLRLTNVGWIIAVTAVLLATGAMLGTIHAQKTAVPKPPDKLALGEGEVRQLLLLMDTDENGKISKQEWMDFMAAEFDRLDKDKRGPGRQGSSAIEFACKPHRTRGEVTPPLVIIGRAEDRFHYNYARRALNKGFVCLVRTLGPQELEKTIGTDAYKLCHSHLSPA